ncbi:MAG TPA: hypothetical protein VM095_03430 [Pyrinomonadaceae bacterium]|nr:hypothetical protein [Pyrinomonadaceae bacterium]
MPNQAKRLKPAQIQEDMEAFAALRAVTYYSPVDPAYSPWAIAGMQASVEAAERAEAQAVAAAEAARVEAIAREWEFHNLMEGAKSQIVAQFGSNSHEAKAVRGTKKPDPAARSRAPKR